MRSRCPYITHQTTPTEDVINRNWYEPVRWYSFLVSLLWMEKWSGSLSMLLVMILWSNAANAHTHTSYQGTNHPLPPPPRRENMYKCFCCAWDGWALPLQPDKRMIINITNKMPFNRCLRSESLENSWYKIVSFMLLKLGRCKIKAFCLSVYNRKMSRLAPWNPSSPGSSSYSPINTRTHI